MEASKHLKSEPFAGAARQFSAKMNRCLARRTGPGARLAGAGWEKIKPWLDRARGELAIAEDAAIRTVLDKNPLAIRLILDGGSGGELGLFCYLPLNEHGAMALVSGGLDGRAPAPEYLCSKDMRPAALYLWLTYAPGALARSMRAIGDCVGELAPDGCPVFSRAVTPHAERLNRTIGLLPAHTVYPNAPDWLLVSLPGREMPDGKPDRQAPKIEIRHARTIEDMMQVVAVRAAVYMAEQLCRYEEEFDGNDFCATHLLGLVDGDAAGCLRLRWFGDFAKLERVAVREQYRRSRLAYRLARAALDHCRRKNILRVYGHSRADLVRFWKVFGFREMKDRAPFSFANVEYREIVAELDPAEDAIAFGGEPMRAIRAEGYWDEIGPLERSNLHASADIARRIDEKTRRLCA